MRRFASHVLFVTACLAVALGSHVAVAQDPLYLVNERTQVESISFKFSDTQTFEPALLEEQIALTDMGGNLWLREKFSFIPFISSIGVHPFLPVEMQKDEVRMERFYNRNGFLHPDVNWLVRLDSSENRVNILYTIREGPPLLLDTLLFRGADGTSASDEFPPSLQEDWRDFRKRAALQQGSRLTDFRLLQLQDQTLGWVRDQGYAFAKVDASSEIDSVRNLARVTVFVDAGPRGRVSEINVEGNESVSATVVTRELPFRVGDRFSHSELVEGQRGVFGLNLFQIALADVPEDQPEDSTVTVRIRVREGDPRIITANGGYFSESGLTSQAQWTHRNFFGGARTFTASVNAQTGIASFATDPDIVYRASVSLRQPYFLNRRLSFSVSPFAEIRDNVIDNSTAFGGNATLLYEVSQLKTASLQYGFETRNVRDYNFGAAGSDTTKLSLIELFQESLLDPGTINRNTLGLSATYGEADDALAPRLGFILRPSAEFAGPPLLSSLEYGRFGLTATGFVPASSAIELYGRVTGGWLTPFGKSLPERDSTAFETLLELRDAVFFAGGTSDTRGWGNALLGPKILDLLVEERIDEKTSAQSLEFSAGPYFPLGSLTKLSATAEVRLPFPGLGPGWRTFAFFDAGRVWTTDDRFDTESDYLSGANYSDTEQFFYGTGAGISFATPVGALRFSVGYKLNPTFFDLRSPTDIAAAVQKAFDDNGGERLEDLVRLAPEIEAAIRGVEPNSFPVFGLFDIPESNRIHLHLSIGQTF